MLKHVREPCGDWDDNRCRWNIANVIEKPQPDNPVAAFGRGVCSFLQKFILCNKINDILMEYTITLLE